jgi:hypothetical protein
MGSAARRRGAYGGEYLRAGLPLRARGGRIKAKKTSQTRAKGYNKDSIAAAAADQKSVPCPDLAISFYRRYALNKGYPASL